MASQRLLATSLGPEPVGAFEQGLVVQRRGSGSANDGGPRPLPPADRAFLDRHWRRPIPPQGRPPARFFPVERSLAPRSCGTCHAPQFEDWSASLHARSMGPGVAGQLEEMWSSDPQSARHCLTCHAPLDEQQPRRPVRSGWQDNPRFDPTLASQGIVCAACHVREHRRFGPPRTDGSVANRVTGARTPHDGATRSTAFLRSEFCGRCHQFRADGFALNGKLLENTYAEWRASPAARRGLQCQNCHMPDRRHLWRGIHDPEMTRSGLTVSLDTGRDAYRPGDTALARLVISNTGVGHHFPTYVTPKVVARLELRDPAGQPVAGSGEERVIAREVALDLSREVADTRIPAGERFVFEYRRPLDREGLRLRATIMVYPDAFYTRFFESALAAGTMGEREQLQRALDATRQSPYLLFVEERPLS